MVMFTKDGKVLRGKGNKVLGTGFRVPRNLEDLRDMLTRGHDKLQMAHDIFDSVHKMVEKPAPWNVAKESMKIAQVLLTREMPNSNDFFWQNDWDMPFSSEMSLVVLDLLKGREARTIKTSDKSNTIRAVDIEDVTLAWVSQEGKAGTDDVWCRPGQRGRAREIINSLLWEKFGDKPLLVRKAKGNKDFENKVALEIDDKIPPLKSKKALEMATYLKRCFDAGVNRSQLYYGPPGTGKSTLVRAVTDILGLRTLRVRVEDVADMDNTLIHEIISSFEPDSIIFDDIDRATMMHHMLEMVDDIKRNVKLLCATANNKQELGDAMLRPGRFDELIEFRYLEEEIIKRELGPANEHLYEAVKKWPIVYIQELVTRRRFMEEEAAVASMAELKKRVKGLKKYSGDDDDEDTEGESVDVDLAIDPDDRPMGPHRFED